MKNDLDKFFWKGLMELGDLQVEGPSDFLELEAIEIFAKLRDCSSAVGPVASGLQTDFLGVLRHFDDLIGHWHSLNEQFTLSYALPQRPMERTNDLLHRHTNIMTSHRQPLVLHDIVSRTEIKSPARWNASGLMG
jgi:hypothetical protein